jgi:hypothetical protein
MVREHEAELSAVDRRDLLTNGARPLCIVFQTPSDFKYGKCVMPRI